MQQLRKLWSEMPEDSRSMESPPRELMHLFGDKWSALLLMILTSGSVRHADLRRTVNAFMPQSEISQFILTQKLRAVERDGLVNRTETSDVPPKVSYCLTKFGEEATARIVEMYKWIYMHKKEIEKARKEFDQSTRGEFYKPKNR
jgi:DNA-binding HxlR family transcriptional regulator